MAVLAEHRAEPAHLPHQPLQDVGTRAGFNGEEAPGLVGQINQDSPGLEHRKRTAAI